MASVFVVFGTCGEYSDRQEWPVKAYLTAEAAQATVDRCNTYARQVVDAADRYDWTNRNWLAAQNADNPSMQTSYTGTEYYLTEIEMGDDMTPVQVAEADFARRRAIAVGEDALED